MEIKIDQVAGYMDSLFKQQDFATLSNIAKQVTQQQPQIAPAWRYLGITAVLSGGGGQKTPATSRCSWRYRS
jgi:hypothetical protein